MEMTETGIHFYVSATESKPLKVVFEPSGAEFHVGPGDQLEVAALHGPIHILHAEQYLVVDCVEQVWTKRDDGNWVDVWHG